MLKPKRAGLAVTLLVALATTTACNGTASEVRTGTTAVPAGAVPFDVALKTTLKRYPYLHHVLKVGPILDELAHRACDGFAHGQSTREVVITQFPDASIDVADAAIEIAIAAFCPQYRSVATAGP